MSYAKSKGTAYETAVVNYLLSCGFTTPRRIVLSGAAGDKGDVWLGSNPMKPDLIIECKNYAKELAYKQVEDFIKEAHTEYKNANKTDIVYPNRALLFIKRPNLGVQDSWVIWKNANSITVRCRLGDLVSVDDENINNKTTETLRIDELVHRLI